MILSFLDKPDPTLAMLVCLEFEAKARLGYSSLDIIIEKARSLSHVDARTFETMSGESITSVYTSVRSFISQSINRSIN